jgi:hypothetical protein
MSLSFANTYVFYINTGKKKNLLFSESTPRLSLISNFMSAIISPCLYFLIVKIQHYFPTLEIALDYVLRQV